MNKICSGCDKEKNVDEFYKNKTRGDGLNGICKLCLKEYSNNHKDNLSVYHHEYYSTHKEKYKYNAQKRKKYYDKNIIILREKHKIRYNSDINFKLSINLRKRIYKALNGINRAKHTIELLGCSIEEFKSHLEKQFDENMNWNNYGTYWHVDHIKPCASFNLSNEKEQKQCFHYTNMQPLEASENIRKSDKYGQQPK